MPAPTITELKSQLEPIIAKSEQLMEKAASDTGLDDEDRVTLKEHLEQSRALKKRIEQAKSDGAALDEIRDMFKGVLPPEGDAGGSAKPAAKSIGQLFVESDGYKGRGGSPTAVAAVEVPDLFKSLVRGGSLGAGGYLLDEQTQRLGTIDQNLFAARVIRQLVDVQTSDAPAIEWLVRTFTNNAAEVGEATSTSGSSGTKPESGHTWTQKSQTSKTIAHWEPCTKKMLNNAGQVKGIIETDLMDGLEDRLEGQAINGDGSGDTLTGILNTSGIQTQGFVTDIFVTLLKSKTAVRLNARRTVSANLLSPEDIESILLARVDGTTGLFLYGGPGAQTGPFTVWGVPTAESENVATGTAIVADWKQAKLFDVVRAQIDWTNSHSDWFVRNIEAVRAEMDVLFAIYQPQAFVEATVVD